MKAELRGRELLSLILFRFLRFLSRLSGVELNYGYMAMVVEGGRIERVTAEIFRCFGCFDDFKRLCFIDEAVRYLRQYLGDAGLEQPVVSVSVQTFERSYRLQDDARSGDLFANIFRPPDIGTVPSLSSGKSFSQHGSPSSSLRIGRMRL